MNIFGKKRLYLDYASATPVSAAAVRAMREAEKLVGNPSSIHKEGVEAKRALETARTKIAAELGCKSREIIFTSGITESNNLAILGSFKKIVLGGKPPKDTHWITSAIEHASVLACFDHIEEMGGVVTRVRPDSRGIISPQAIAKKLRKETVFVSVGWANNEIGTVAPLSDIWQVLRAHEEKNGMKVIFHSDAGQGPMFLSPQVHSLRVDLFSLGSAKLYGSHGIGLLYASNRAEPAPMILGGGQEKGIRSGTESVALAAGFAEALSQLSLEREIEGRRISKLRDTLAAGLTSRIQGAVINGNLKHTIPHMLNISIPNIKSEYLMLSLDQAGIAISTKSACNEGEGRSHVVQCLIDAESTLWRAENSLRFSLGRETTARDINMVIEKTIAIVNRLVQRAL